MASSKWSPRTGSGSWSGSSNWTPAVPVTGSDVTIGATNDTSNVVVGEDVTIAINSLSLIGASSGGYTTTLTLTPGKVLTIAGAVSLGVRTSINGSGSLVANGAISGSGSISASNGLLNVSGAGSLSGTTLSIGTSAPSTLSLNLRTVSTGAITINNANQTLQIGSGTNVTITAAETVASGTLQMSGGTLTDTHTITLGAMLAGGTITGFGTLAANVSAASSSIGTIIRVAGGTLDMRGNVSVSGGNITLAIDSSAPATLQIDGKAATNSVIAMSSANQTLEVGAAGALTINAAESITGGMIKLDGGKLTDASGLTIGAGATLKGLGTVTAPISGTGTVIASGGVLDLVRALSAGPTYRIDSTAGSVLRVDAAAAAGTIFTFAGSTGALELANVTSGTVRGFSGTITGLSVGASATVPTTYVNIQSTVTKATLSGSQIVVANGATTVATLNLATAQAAGAYAVAKADATLGGYDVFLSSAGPSVTWSPPANPGVEGSAIALGTLTPSSGNTLTSVLVSGIPVGAKLSDGTNSFTATTGNTSTNVLGWNYAGLSITPAGDANFSLSAQVTDSANNVSPATAEAVTVNPLAPTVTPVAVSGTAGQPILLNLGVTAAGLAGDANALSSVTISGIPAGATLANTNHDTLTPTNGSISFTAAQLAAGVRNGLSLTLPSAGSANLSISATEVDAEGNASAAATATESVTANGAPTVTWSPPANPGVEGSAIALGTLTPSSGNTLTSVLVSGIPVGAKLSDGTNSFTATTGNTSTNVLGWNYAGLSITPAGDANFSLSAQVTDSANNVSPATAEAVTVNPLAPTVTPVAVSGTAGQPILLNLGVTAAGLAGDANALSSVTISGIPAGATLANTNHDTLTPTNGSISFTAAQLAAGVRNGLSLTLPSAGSANLSISATEVDAEGNASVAASGSETVTANAAGNSTPGVPAYSHIVVVMEENHGYSDIIGSADAPYINLLASKGMLLTNYSAITHPSQPNYFSLYAGSTFGIIDDNPHTETGSTLATILQGAGKTFTGYVEHPNASYDHNPWESFPEGTSVESDFSTFGQTGFGNLPTVAFIAPNTSDDMHNGTVGQADAWLQSNIDAYAQWAKANNSLLVVAWDESGDNNATNQVAAILYGAQVDPSTNATAYNHYNMLSTILAASGLTGPNNAATAAPIQGFSATNTVGGGSGRTISTALTGPVVLAPADNPLTITSSGSVTSSGAGADGIDGPAGINWTISNSGGVSSAAAFGISFGSGGDVTNSGQISGVEAIRMRNGGSVVNASGGSISASGAVGGGFAVGAGVYISGAAGSVTNRGSVTAGAYGVAFARGGSVSNTGSIAGGEDGVIIQGGAGRVSNSGRITASVDDGVALNAGGTITNDAGATILGHGTGGAAIFITGGTATVTNNGTLAGDQHHAVLIQSGGSVTNGATGTITAQNTGVFFKTLPGTVTNYGQISASGPEGTGVYLENNGNVINAQGGTITGAKFGAFIEGGAGSLANYGSISGGSYDGVVLGLGGTVTNAAGASIFGKSGGVYAKYRAPASVTNAGTIGTTGTTGAGIDLADGGSATNNTGGSVSGADHGIFIAGGTATVTNRGKVTGSRYHGIHLGAGGTVTSAAGASVTGGSSGIYAGKTPGAVVNNAGAVSATSSTGAGADLEAGGTLTNAVGGSFSGGAFGVFLTGTAGTVTNSGTMSGAHGVGLEAGGSLTNNANASIQGQTSGVFAQGGSASVTNSGSITASASGGAGADIEAGGTVTNNAGASMTGAAFGVFLSGGGTVVNAGTIGGASYAVKFGGSGTNNRLVVQTGAVFNGAVGGASGGNNVLELAGGTGTLSGVSSGSGSVTQGGQGWSFFGGFGTVQVDSGATWNFSGTDSVAAVVNQGTIGVLGSLNITSALDPASTGLFQLASSAGLEVAAATGSGAQIAFLGTSTLTVDNFAAFGANAGTSSYSGPLLEDFTTGDGIDLKNFGAAGLSTPVFDASTGRLQITNGAAQSASLMFQVSSLGTGTLQATSDGGSGTRVFLA